MIRAATRMTPRSITTLSAAALLFANACKAVSTGTGDAKISRATTGDTASQYAFAFAHGVRLYVSVLAQARADLGLTVPVRLIRTRELEQYKSIGGAPLPMALLVKGRQLKTIVAGESMPRTMGLVEASLTATAPPNHHNTPEE